MRMKATQNIIAIQNQKMLMKKIISQEDKDDDDNTTKFKVNKVHFTKSLSPQLKSPNTPINYLPNKTTAKKTLVLDLDETLVHSSFSPYDYPADITIKIDIEGQKYDIYVLIRPGVKEFLSKMSQVYELVLFTASLSAYANPVMNIIDRERHCAYRLYREHCTLINSTFIKELRKLNRDMKEIIIVDNSPLSYICNKENGIPIYSWYDNIADRELTKLISVLEFLALDEVEDVREYIPKFVINNELSSVKANYIMKKFEYEHKPITNSNKDNYNGNTSGGNKDQKKSSNNINAFELHSNGQSSSASSTNVKKKKKKYYLGVNSKVKEIKPLINIKIVNNNISNIFINKQIAPLTVKSDSKSKFKDSFQKERDKERDKENESKDNLMRLFLKDNSGLNTPNNTIRNNIVMNYQVMKEKIKQKKHSKGDSLLFNMNKYNLITPSLSPNQTHNYSNVSITSNAANNPVNINTCSNSESRYFTDLSSTQNQLKDFIDRPITSIRLNAFNHPNHQYSKPNSNILTHSFNNTMSNQKNKTNSFSVGKNEWRAMNNTKRPITSKKGKVRRYIDKSSLIKELRIDSNDFMIQRYKPNVTSRITLKKYN